MKWLVYLSLFAGGYIAYQSWTQDAIRVEVDREQVAQVANEAFAQGKRKLAAHAPALREKVQDEVKKQSKAIGEILTD